MGPLTSTIASGSAPSGAIIAAVVVALVLLENSHRQHRALIPTFSHSVAPTSSRSTCGTAGTMSLFRYGTATSIARLVGATDRT